MWLNSLRRPKTSGTQLQTKEPRGCLLLVTVAGCMAKTARQGADKK